ncbi:MAG: hypothetical protein AB1894_17595 [Chloroflexota bacterium]
MSRLYWPVLLVAALIVCAALSACASQPAALPTASPSPIPSPSSTPIPTAGSKAQATPALEVLALRRNQTGETVTLHVGQVLFVANPNPALNWGLEYANQILRRVEPTAAQEQGQPGWYLRAQASGETQLMLTSMAACDNPPCPPAVMQMVFYVEVGP